MRLFVPDALHGMTARVPGGDEHARPSAVLVQQAIDIERATSDPNLGKDGRPVAGFDDQIAGSKVGLDQCRGRLGPGRLRSQPAARLGGLAQCAEAPEAPSPVSDRMYCDSNAADSLRAVWLRSRTENSQMPTKATAIENSAGLS